MGDMQDVLGELGLTVAEHSFDGCVREEDAVSACMVLGDPCLTSIASVAPQTETRFLFVAGPVESTFGAAPLDAVHLNLSEYDWEDIADLLPVGDSPVATDPTVTVASEEMHERCESIRAQLSELERQLAEMKAKLSELRANLATAQAEKARLEALADDLRQKKATCPDDIVALQNAIPPIEARLTGLQQSLREAVGYYRECMGQHGSGSYRCRGWGDGVTAVHQRLEELRGELAARRAALQSLQEMCIDLDSRLHLTVTPRLSRLELAIGEYEETIAALSSHISGLQGRIAQAREQFRDCLEEAEELEKLEKRLTDARARADSSVSKARRRIEELKGEHDRLERRFPDGVYPDGLDRLENEIEEIEDDIGASASRNDEEGIRNGGERADAIRAEVEHERARMRRYYRANICLERCSNAYTLRLTILDDRRDLCAASPYFSDAERILSDLKACCDMAREQLEADNPVDSRRLCRDCLYERGLSAAFSEALRRACADSPRASAAGTDEAGLTDEELDSLLDFEVNMGLQALGELANLPGTIVRVFEAGEIAARQQRNACCALAMLRMVLSSRSRVEAEIYAFYFSHLWHEIAGLPELPLVSYNAAFRLADIVEHMPADRKQDAVSAINVVLRGPRCAVHRAGCLE